jgi:RNA polymerase sigma factor (sigma-70 family)
MALSDVSSSVARDYELLSAMVRGDEHAFREFYGRHVQAALGLASRVLRDAALAEDAVQEAFLAAWRQAGSYRPARGKPSSWLLTFVHRRAVDQVRREQRHAADPLELEEMGAPTAEDGAVSDLPNRAWIAEGLTRLAPRDREVLELAYFGGLTQPEIAERLQAPLGTVKSRTFGALRRLNEALAA